MRFGDTARKAGILLFASLILFSTSGIHSDACHLSTNTPAQQNHFYIGIPAIGSSEPEHCNSCFFAQILNQSLVPDIGTVIVSESFILNEPLFIEAALCTPLNHAVNRGPPTAIILL
jgi:hypothetical protein